MSDHRQRDPIDEGFGIPVFEPAATPKERLRQVFQANDLGVNSFEYHYAKRIALTSAVIGTLFNGIKMGLVAEETWKKTHYHSLFMNEKDYKRYYMNYIARRFFLDGGKFGIRAGILSGVMALTTACLAARRDKARITDVGIGGALASFLYRIDVGPKAMLASGILGGVFWQVCALAALPLVRLTGYTWDGFYKEFRRVYYEEENGRTRFYNEMDQIEIEESLWPWQKHMRWAQKKLEEEQRLSELRKASKGAPEEPPQVTPKKDEVATPEKK